MVYIPDIKTITHAELVRRYLFTIGYLNNYAWRDKAGVDTIASVQDAADDLLAEIKARGIEERLHPQPDEN